MREYLRKPGNDYGSSRPIEEAMLAFSEGRFDDGRYFYNRTPGPDGLNSLQKSITFIENHDGLNRFRVDSVTERRHQLAQAMVMTLPGIPCIYYGAEVGMHDSEGRIGHDGETGRMTLWKRNDTPALSEVRSRSSFRVIARLAATRRNTAALREGAFRPLWSDSGDLNTDDGVFAFARVMPDLKDSAVVVFNASDRDGKTGPLALDGIFPAGSSPSGQVVLGERSTLTGGSELNVPANSVVIYRPVIKESP
jgi:glycosidase